MIIADTSVWINYFNGVQNRQTDILNYLLTSQLILMGDLRLTKTLQDCRRDLGYQLAERELSHLPFVEKIGR